MLDKLLKAAVGVVTIPVDVVADVVTLGGDLTDRDQLYTTEKVEKIINNLDAACDPEKP